MIAPVLRRFAAGTLASALVFGAWYVHAAQNVPARGEAYVERYSNPTTPGDLMLAWGDGQAYAYYVHGLRDGEPGPYMASRPLLPWLARVTGGPLVGLAVVSILASGVVVALGGWWLLPLLAVSIRGLGPEALGMALVLGGLRFPRWRLFLFALAGLARETYLLVPAVMGWRQRRLWLAFVPWAGWGALVAVKMGLPQGSGAFGPLHPPKDLPSALAMAATLTVAVLGVVRRKDGLALGMLALVLMFPEQTWASWHDSLRVALPVWYFALNEAAPWSPRREPPEGRAAGLREPTAQQGAAKQV